MKLEEIFPKSGFSESEIDRFVYSRDGSSYEGKCEAIVWPTHKDQILKLILYARRTGNKLTIRGAATSTYGGCVPAEAVVIDISKMNQILAITNEYVSVQAGVTLDDLNRALARGKRTFPIVPPEHAVCTIGGMIATNTLGMDTYYGRMEDWVEEIEVIDGTGKNITLNGDQLKDFVGKEGITGVIYKAKLKVIPMFSQKTISLFKFNTLTSMMDRVKELDSMPNVMSIEFFDEYTSKMLDLGEAFHLLVEFDDDTGLIQKKDEIESIRELKEKLHHTLVKKKLIHKEDPKIPMQHMAQFLHWLRKHQIVCYGHLKRRVFHPCFKEHSKRQQDMYTVVKKLGGRMVAEYPVGIQRKDLIPEQSRNKLEALKNKYDNQKIMNRGVVID